MPTPGREFISRFEVQTERAFRMWPGRTGLIHFTSSIPAAPSEAASFSTLSQRSRMNMAQVCQPEAQSPLVNDSIAAASST